jgi:hypothetical protein
MKPSIWDDDLPHSLFQTGTVPNNRDTDAYKTWREITKMIVLFEAVKCRTNPGAKLGKSWG